MGKVIEQIDGVIVTPLKQIEDKRGAVFHVLRKDSKIFNVFGEVYFSKVNPGVVKAWKIHKEMTQNFCVPFGNLKLVIYDDRPALATRGIINEFLLNPDTDYKLITIPPGLWYGFKCVGSTYCLLLNIADKVHDPKESSQISYTDNKIPYKW